MQGEQTDPSAVDSVAIKPFASNELVNVVPTEVLLPCYLLHAEHIMSPSSRELTVTYLFP
jgi:hypothetical protein